MAFTVSTDAQLVFFSTVFGPIHPITEKVKALLGTGVTFEVSLYGVRAYVGGKSISHVKLTCGTTSLMKHMGDVNVVASNKVLIYDWINKIHADHGSPVATAKTPITKATTAMYVLLTGFAGLEKKIPVIKAVMTATAMKLKDAKQTVEASLHAPVNLGTFPAGDAKTVADSLSAAGAYVKLEPAGSPTGASWGSDTFSATPVDAVIDLKNAKAVGQKVHGTSPGSVYYTVALTDHVKLAARLYKTGSISIRAEWTDNPTAELKKLEDSGLQLKMGQSYGSIHFEAAGVPVERVVGAFLFGTGIAWKATVMTGTNLIIAEKA